MQERTLKTRSFKPKLNFRQNVGLFLAKMDILFQNVAYLSHFLMVLNQKNIHKLVKMLIANEKRYIDS